MDADDNQTRVIISKGSAATERVKRLQHRGNAGYC